MKSAVLLNLVFVLEALHCRRAWAFGRVEKIFSFVFPALTRQLALLASATCRAIFGSRLSALGQTWVELRVLNKAVTRSVNEQ